MATAVISQLPTTKLDHPQEPYSARTNSRDKKWRLNSKNSQVLSHKTTFKVLISTRTDAEIDYIPENLYSSLKYRFTFIIENPENLPVMLMYKLRVVNSKGKQVTRDGKSILKGVTEQAITKDVETGNLVGRTKVQFGDVSFHHDLKQFFFELALHLPSDLTNPVAVIRSAPFQVFARRMSSQALKKRKHTDCASSEEEGDEEDFEQQGNAKRQRTNTKSKSLNEFMTALEQLLEFRNQNLFTEEDQKESLDSAFKTLLSPAAPKYVPIQPLMDPATISEMFSFNALQQQVQLLPPMEPLSAPDTRMNAFHESSFSTFLEMPPSGIEHQEYNLDLDILNEAAEAQEKKL